MTADAGGWQLQARGPSRSAITGNPVNRVIRRASCHLVKIAANYPSAPPPPHPHPTPERHRKFAGADVRRRGAVPSTIIAPYLLLSPNLFPCAFLECAARDCRRTACNIAGQRVKSAANGRPTRRHFVIVIPLISRSVRKSKFGTKGETRIPKVSSSLPLFFFLSLFFFRRANKTFQRKNWRILSRRYLRLIFVVARLRSR